MERQEKSLGEDKSLERKREMDSLNLYSGGAIAIILLCLQGFLALQQLDLAAFLSVFAFALSLPILGFFVLLNNLDIIHERFNYTEKKNNVKAFLFFYVGNLSLMSFSSRSAR